MSAIGVRIDAQQGDAGRCGDLIDYIHSPGKNVNERVICHGSGGLMAHTPAGIAAEISATSTAARERDKRTSQDPLEHFVISFESGDSVTDADFRRAAEIAVKHLGLEHHQYAWAAHDDTNNLHLHLVVSRIDPATLRAIDVKFPVKQAEQIGALINHSFGMRPMPGNRYAVNESGMLEKIQSASVKQPDLLREIITSAQSWAEFHQRTRTIGINYQKKGSGALINGEKASDIDRKASMAKLVKRWGEYVASPDALPVPEREIPKAVERAKKRADERGHLTDKQRDERTALYQSYKTKKQAAWKDTDLTSMAKRGLVSLLAAEHAKSLAALRDKQGVERAQLRGVLNEHLPLLDKPAAIETIITGPDRPAKMQDIRDYTGEAIGSAVEYSTGGRAADFIDTGATIRIMDTRESSVLAALQLAQSKWPGGFNVNGDDAYKQMCVRLCVRGMLSIKNPELQDAIAAERLRYAAEKKSVMETHYQQFDEFKQLADALPADAWRVTLGSYIEIPMVDGAGKPVMVIDPVTGEAKQKTFNPTKVLRDDAAAALNPSGEGKGHDGLTVAQIKQRMGQIVHAQSDPTTARVILTPASKTHYIVHIDDVSPAALAELEQDGYTAAVIIQTSPNKRSVILTTPRDLALNADQQREIGKALTQRLNAKYGDPDARNQTQPFRWPGFANMKPKYVQADGSYPAIALERASKQDCARLAELTRELQNELATAPVNQERAAAREARQIVVADPSMLGIEARAYMVHAASIRKDALAGKLAMRRREDGTLDQSGIDALAAQRMLMTGWTAQQIAAGVAQGCNVVRQEHQDALKFAPVEFAVRMTEIAAKIDLARFAGQVKYRLKDEAAAGIESPKVAAERKAKEAVIHQAQQKAAMEFERKFRALAGKPAHHAGLNAMLKTAVLVYLERPESERMKMLLDMPAHRKEELLREIAAVEQRVSESEMEIQEVVEPAKPAPVRGFDRER